MMSSIKGRLELINITLITLGSALLASGVAFFLVPAQITTGGTPGIAILLHFLTSISTGTLMVLINVPLLLVGAKFIGMPFTLRSIYSIIITSVLVDFFLIYIDFPAINSLLLSTIYGGTLIGAGVGLVLKGHASAGGSTIIAQIVSNYWHVKAAKVILILDVLIIVATGFVFADMELALWSMLSIYATTRIVDKILVGVASEKIVHIVSKQAPVIGEQITKTMGRDGTILSGQNLTSQDEKTILFVVVGARKIPQLRKLVLEQDPKALMIVVEASEMMGSSKII